MEAIMSSNGSMLEVASMLINNANASSGRDNITVVVYEHGVSQLVPDGKRPY